MSVSVTIRDVPDEVRDELAARAARSGRSLQEFLRGLLVERAGRPSIEDLSARVRTRVNATGVSLATADILAARDEDRR